MRLDRIADPKGDLRAQVERGSLGDAKDEVYGPVLGDLRKKTKSGGLVVTCRPLYTTGIGAES